MFDVLTPQRQAVRIDLASVRDTLLYIESDLNQSPTLNGVATAIRAALVEIERLQDGEQIDAPGFTGSRFLPAQL